MRVRIITDDFTSALDGTACFAERGWDTAVLTRQDSLARAAVVSLDTDTREHGDARGTDIAAAAALAWRDADVLVLQFDSTLRGRVARDCLAVRAASGRRKLLIAAAFPLAGRTTEGGRVLVHGVPVEQTAFGRDPSLPVHESHIPALFAAHGVAVAVAREACDARSLLEHHDAVAVDARTEADLDAIAALFASRHDLLWAGSTGLLRALARTLPMSCASAGVRCAAPLARRPWLVVGSINPVSRRQLEAARSQSHVKWLATSAECLPGSMARHAALRDLVEQAVTGIRDGACDGLVVTGGETARRIVDALPAVSVAVCAPRSHARCAARRAACRDGHVADDHEGGWLRR